MLKKSLFVIYCLCSMGLLYLGYLFEEPYGSRRGTLMVLIALYIIALLSSWMVQGRDRHLMLVSILMVVLLLTIEIYSKYAVNYFMHTLYIMLIFFNIAQMMSRRIVLISLMITLVSFVKFIQLILIDNTFANIALMVFFGSVQLLVVVVGVFLKVYQDESKKTKEVYRELLESHNQLKVYAAEIKELSQIEARSLIARDLHDTLGHELTGLIMQMEMASTYFDDEDSVQGKALLQASKKSARESLVQVRKIVETLKNSADQTLESTSIQGLIQAFMDKTGCQVTYKERGQGSLGLERANVLYRVVQESLTNAVRHGHASRVRVSLIYGSELVQFELEDDGSGCEHLVLGNGLGGMIERLEEVGGRLDLESNPHFRVWGSLPYKEEKV